MEPRAPHQKKCSPKVRRAGKAGKRPGEGARHGLEGVRAFTRKLEGLGEEAASHVEGDEGPHDGRVPGDARPRLLVQGDVGVPGEVPGGEEVAPEHQPQDPHEDQEGEEVGHDIVCIPNTSPGVEAEEAFQKVHEVHEEVVDEAVKDEGVEEGDEGPPLEHGLLGEDEPEGPPDPLGQAVKPLLGPAPPYGEVDPAEARVGVIKASRSEEDKEDFLR